MRNANGIARTTEMASDEEIARAAEIVRTLRDRTGRSLDDLGESMYVSGSYLSHVARERPSSGSRGLARVKIHQVIDLGTQLLDALDAPAAGNGTGANHLALNRIAEVFGAVTERLEACATDLRAVRDEVPHPLLRPGIDAMIERVEAVRAVAAGEENGTHAGA